MPTQKQTRGVCSCAWAFLEGGEVVGPEDKKAREGAGSSFIKLPKTKVAQATGRAEQRSSGSKDCSLREAWVRQSL